MLVNTRQISVHLVETRPNWYVITNDEGSHISSEQYHTSKAEAIRWAENWVTSYRGVILKVKK